MIKIEYDEFLYSLLAEVSERLEKHYGLELDADERSAIGDEMHKQINIAASRL